MAGGSEERRSLLGAAAHGQPPPAARRSTAPSAGRACGSRAAARRSRSPWRRSWATGCAWARRHRARRRAGGVTVTLAGGETLRAEAVVCALPVGPLRDVAVTGVSDARLGEPAPPAPGARGQGRRRLPAADLARGRRQRARGGGGRDRLDLAAGQQRAEHARRPGAARPLPRRAAARAPRGGARPARPPLRPGRGRARRLPRAPLGRRPVHKGYIAQWAPGDLTAVGPLHGTHEPPFYVAGSDHWVVGYMEGAVRTGRAAAAAALGARGALIATASRAGGTGPAGRRAR